MKKYIRIEENELRGVKSLLISNEIPFEEVEFPNGLLADEKVVDNRTEDDYYQSSSDWEDSGC